METKVVLFSSDSYNLEELKSMSPAELVELAEEIKMLGDPDAEISTPAEFQQHFNAGEVDPDHTYIFFVTL